MLKPYRRHSKDCPHKNKGRDFIKCRCPIWVQGVLDNEELRESLKTSNWEKALLTLRDWELDGRNATKPELKLLGDAFDAYIEDARGKQLKEDTIKKYERLFNRMKGFATDKGLRFLKEFDLAHLRQFRATWTFNNNTASKEIERLRAFFNFCREAEWLPNNPASKLKRPRVDSAPTLPFEDDEMQSILNAVNVYPDNYGNLGGPNAHRLRAFVLTMRYSGLAIRDTVTLRKDHLKGDKLFLRRQKTGVPVSVKLPAFVVESLNAAKNTNEEYFFWTGGSNPKSAVGNWDRSLRKLFKLAKVVDGHSHRFRDTFATNLLLAGTPIETVSKLLGHTSVQTTERHYAPWVRSRQIHLEEEVERSWKHDPIYRIESSSTKSVQRPS